ncbi:hypothetical protein D3C72_1273350 [compost metagenome]
MRINRFIDVETPTEAELFTLNPSLKRKLPPTAQEIDGILQRLDQAMDTTTSAGMMDPVLKRVAAVALDLDNRADVSYSPTQRGVLLFEAAREALHQNKRNWRQLPAPPKPIRVSKEVAQSLANAGTNEITFR